MCRKTKMRGSEGDISGRRQEFGFLRRFKCIEASIFTTISTLFELGYGKPIPPCPYLTTNYFMDKKYFYESLIGFRIYRSAEIDSTM